MTAPEFDEKHEAIPTSNGLTNAESRLGSMEDNASSPLEASETEFPPEQEIVEHSVEDNINVNPSGQEILDETAVIHEEHDQTLLQTLSQQIDTLREEYAVKLEEEFLAVKNLFETKLLIDREKDSIIANQNKELQNYRADLRRKLLLPVLMQIIHEIDLIRKQIPFFEKDESPERAEKILQYLSSIPEDLLEILRSQSVDEFIYEESETFNPAKQKSISVIATDEQKKDKRIAARVLPGYIFEDKIIRPEQVRVYVLKNNV